MHDAMLVRGFAVRTRQAYIEAIAKLAHFYHANPALLSPGQVEAWLLHLVRDRKLSYSTVNQAASACRFLYATVLKRDSAAFAVPMAKTPQRQPDILARAELAALFAAADSLKSRVLLQTAYAAGLRVSEWCAPQSGDIDSQPDRMCLRIRQGKGGQDRYTLLPPTLLEMLRLYWRAYRPKNWLFPNRNGSGPMDVKGVQRRFYQARDTAGIGKSGGIHPLRHAFATHLLEAGVDRVTLQKLLGHHHLTTTSRYLHLASTQWRPPACANPLDLLAALPKPHGSRFGVPVVSATLAQVCLTFGAESLDGHGVSSPQVKVLRAVLDCRTPALGGHCLACEDCGQRESVYHSCRNRHCPTCQTRAKDAWTRQRLIELLPVPYGHLVFTLPHALNSLTAAHPRWVYDTLMHTVAATLTEFAAHPRWWSAEPAFTAVLQTWTQDLRRHVHLHVLIACGGLDQHGNWVEPKRNNRFLVPVHALSRVFRAQFHDALDAARQAGKLPRDPAAAAKDFAERRRNLLKHDGVVYAKTPLGGPAEVLGSLSRYTHRTAVSNERIVAIRDGHVLLRVRADDQGGQRVIRIHGPAFIGRFLQQVLPPGFKRIRHFGLLSSAHQRDRLGLARAALQAPQPSPPALEAAGDFMRRVAKQEIDRCPGCGQGRLRVVAVLSPNRSAQVRPPNLPSAAAASPLCQNKARSPPITLDASTPAGVLIPQSIAVPAVQSNKVYPPRLTHWLRLNLSGATDKRYSLGLIGLVLLI
jgi:site-specific recombinase XerD